MNMVRRQPPAARPGRKPQRSEGAAREMRRQVCAARISCGMKFVNDHACAPLTDTVNWEERHVVRLYQRTPMLARIFPKGKDEQNPGDDSL
jgi:hypothetical protein